MTFCVYYVTNRRVELVLLIFGFYPLLSHHLRSIELGNLLLDLVVLVHHKHVVGAPAIFASRMRGRIRQVVIIMSAFTAGSEKTREGIGQPQRSKDIHGSIAAMAVGFGIEHGDARWQSVISPHLH